MTCPSLPLVEARHDGRLGHKEVASLERHLAGCGPCREHAEDLASWQELGERAGELAPLSPLEHRRGRLAVLRRAAEPLPETVTRRRTPAFALAAAIAVVLAVLLAWPATPRLLSQPSSWPSTGLGPFASSDESDTSARPGPPTATLEATPRTRVERSLRANEEWVRLREGSIVLTVEPLSPGQRFVVATGDAEVEVRGTRFRVTAVDDRLTEVMVYEGKVAVRHGHDELLLLAGESWTPHQTAVLPGPRVAPNVGAAASDVPTVAPVAAVATDASSEPPSAADATAPKASAAEESPETSELETRRRRSAASREFAAAVGQIDAGDPEAAARALSDFSARHPDDVRAEDADFLAIVALQRAGRHAAAALAAQRYLARHPAGARRAEAAAIAQRQPK